MLKQPTFLFWTFSMHQMIFFILYYIVFSKIKWIWTKLLHYWKWWVQYFEPASKLCFQRFWCKICEFKRESSWDKPGKTLEKLRDDGQEVREKDDIKGEMKVHFFLNHMSLNYLVAPPCLRVETNDIFYASIVVHEQKLTGKGTFSFRCSVVTSPNDCWWLSQESFMQIIASCICFHGILFFFYLAQL